MKHISIIAPNEQTNMASVACIVGAFEIFTQAQSHWQERGNKAIYRIEIVGTGNQAVFGHGLLNIKPHQSIDHLMKTDLIIIPSMANDFDRATAGNKHIVDWIARQYKTGAEVASMCSGAFLLASTGLLDGKNCSTHWNIAESFKLLFPKINLQADMLITDENGLYTNGGAYSFLNLVIYLVEKYFDRETAVYCSKLFQIEIDRRNQSPFVIFTGQKRHSDEMVKRAQALIESTVSEKIVVENLSAKFAIGRRNFDRRFFKATGNTPKEYAQRVKIEAAKKALETTGKPISEVMYDVGYSDFKAFRELFRRITGVSPLTYKNKYNKDAKV